MYARARPFAHCTLHGAQTMEVDHSMQRNAADRTTSPLRRRLRCVERVHSVLAHLKLPAIDSFLEQKKAMHLAEESSCQEKG